MRKIHPTAVISPEVEIGEDVEIGPYAVIEGNVKIGCNCKIGPFVHIQGYTEIGENTRIFTGAIIGSIPQDLKYKGEITYLRIGKNNTIREFVTINPGTSKGEETKIGDNNLIMAYCHIAHNCVIKNNVIMANYAALAGHVVVEDYAIIGGLSGVHQFCKIGKHSIIGGTSKVTMDILPYVIADGHPARPYGINVIGLKRRNFSKEKIEILENAYKIIFRSGLNTSEALKKLEQMNSYPEIQDIIEFIKSSERGIARERGK
ncbi:MAG: acyl-ACP--UDP-N-acetylglucosamine O-acyltransferase [Candidatus Omnitrophica bacterium]|nr:acyl-ACP--UDP-N-acetylglucosamine O-acyltransferase [Candidatus Omnitrophota bacterium]MCM8802750.1 acyl-ACP--UDP-N-acetylglucosamine O-acyltransferase [Candidatus Omnitrophota bacterium]